MNLIICCMNIIRESAGIHYESRNPPRIQVDSESRTSNLGVTDPSPLTDRIMSATARCSAAVRHTPPIRIRTYYHVSGYVVARIRSELNFELQTSARNNMKYVYYVIRLSSVLSCHASSSWLWQ